jgi:hypothetical protein
MVYYNFEPDDGDSIDDALEKVRGIITPDLIERHIRQAALFCWANLPAEQRNIDDLERRIQGVVHKVLHSVRADFDRAGPKWWLTSD